ncbi:MAG TPA: lactate utilization protein C [Rhodocyclaceae bacterium]|jgi:L-lactate dehydrogenase complex protein LldG|nr:lactate utilization protein C [Rhodocyclaceae bacterium]HRQ46384.1 lactate utilization protein C [Rhodocyclaceae bacterium]
MSIGARDDILGRVRSALGRTADNRAGAVAEVEMALAARTRGPRPVAPTDPVARFRAEGKRMSSTLDEVASLEDVPAAVGRYLASCDLPRQAVAWPKLAVLDWRGAGLDVVSRSVTADDPVGITGCFCAIAETGTLMLCSGPETPAATSLLPETHIAVVPVSRIVAGMEEAWTLLRAECGAVLPRAVNFVSGPSRTGDIEMTIVLGAHGPYRVHLLLVNDV